LPATPALLTLTRSVTSVHCPAVPPQIPEVQASAVVHASPSLQAVPSGAAGLLQLPVAGLQTPASWHASLAEQVTGFAPLQVPAWQASVWVHAFPSLHAVPSGAAGLLQLPVAGLQTPAT
jgi:hypothetical protein